MQTKLSYRIITIGLRVGLGVLALAAAGYAQQPSTTTPSPADLYCSGVVTDQAVPGDSYIISGEDSRYKSTFSTEDYIYINQGAEHGVKVGDQFDVVRATTGAITVGGIVRKGATTPWFKYENMLNRAMGTRYADIGRLRVVHVEAKTSVAQIALGCDLMQRGDLVRPFAARPAPQFHSAKLDLFAAPSGKKTAMVVSTKDSMVLAGPNKIIYVNLGSAQGVNVGDYFRVFRYQGTHNETSYQIQNMNYKAYGFGSTPVAYKWDDLPRQVMGEGIVLRTGPNSSTVLLTTTREEVFIGDYVEVE
ncbi:MAG TPA: hypothetical protein VKT71_08965 [Candidatus Acidoferrales bacterium]|nr:hypothetical protein [Candidatus Acidoferrales bacterium]